MRKALGQVLTRFLGIQKIAYLQEEGEKLFHMSDEQLEAFMTNDYYEMKQQKTF